MQKEPFDGRPQKTVSGDYRKVIYNGNDEEMLGATKQQVVTHDTDDVPASNLKTVSLDTLEKKKVKVANNDQPLVSDAALMLRVTNDDQDAYRQLVRRHFDRMFKLALKMLYNPEDAEDVAQDVFFKLWLNRHSWKSEGALFTTWLYRVTVNRCIDFKRRTQNVQIDDHLEIVDTSDDAVTTIQKKQTAKTVKEATLELSDQQQAAIALYYHEGLSCVEAAKVLGTSVNAVESLLKRARQKLRKILKEGNV